MEFATAVATPVVESLMARVKKDLDYWFSSATYVRKMNDRLSALNDTAADRKMKKETNDAANLVVPNHVLPWLLKVEAINKEAGDIPTRETGCFNLRRRYKAGKGSFDILEKIDDLENEESKIKWTNEPIPLGMVTSSTMSSSSKPVDDDDVTQNILTSRKLIFERALKSLEPGSNTQKIALCGMGGQGKTTMMEKLKKVVEKKEMFKWVLRADVGEKYDPIAVQTAIAQYTSEILTETTRDARATRLEKRFEGMSENGKNKILVILDNVWEEIDLKDIGLKSPLPGGFKLLITSREEKVCSKMEIEADSIFKMVGLEKKEARFLFWETVGLSDVKGDLHETGEGILNMCGGLPLAINAIAKTLKGENVGTWKDALLRLQRHDPENLYDIVGDIFDISYNNLKREDKSVFILCGLFPNDFNIPKEELMRYGWGLRLFQNVYNLMEARDRTYTCVSNLIHANLLNESDEIGCVRMHDLARAFVLSNYSKFKQASIISHSDESEWPATDAQESCERILVKCTGMYEFPQDFYYSSLSLMKLINGDELLKFPEDFHKRMEKLVVMAYDEMKCPLDALSLSYYTSLRTLCLHSCSLADDDLSFLGNIETLEVLSLAHCGIKKLPFTITKLKRLRLLDLTGCINLSIENGVFQNLKKLEELYMRVSKEEGIKFTDVIRKEMEMLLLKLNALEVEFFENILQWKNVSFDKIQKFRISVGCFLRASYNNKYLLKNTLRLVTKCSDLLECKIIELFSKTEELQFSVEDIVENISMSPSSHLTFCNLKVLHVFNCPKLTHLFTIPVANGLKQLESLEVSSCLVLKSLVSLCDDGVNIMELPQLMQLTLEYLPNFTSIILENHISATESLFSKQVVLPKFSKLKVENLNKLKQIWASDITIGEEESVSMLREITVFDCESLVNLFPVNPMRLLSHLEDIVVIGCSSVEALFNIDLSKVGKHSTNNCNLRRINVAGLKELREVWRIENENNSRYLIRGFQGIEVLSIRNCKKFRNIFTPTTTNFDMGALVDIYIWECGKENVESVNYSQEEEDMQVTSISKMQEISKVNEHMPIFAFSSYFFNQLRNLHLDAYEGVDVVFEIESQSINTNRELVTTQQQPLLPLFPCLEGLKLESMNMLSHVWKCSNWNEYFSLHQHQTQSSFRNLTTIYVYECASLKYLFSPCMSKLLSSLKVVQISWCEGMEEIVSNIDDDEDNHNEALTTSTTTLFPCLDYLELEWLDNLKHIGGAGVVKGKTNVVVEDKYLKYSQVGVVSWSLCQYFRKISIQSCDALSSVVPSYAAGEMPKLQELNIFDCNSMVEVFETKEINHYNNISDCSSNVDQRSQAPLLIPRTTNITIHKFYNLESLTIASCHGLTYAFTFSTFVSLAKLEKLSIYSCSAMKVIVREEYGEVSSEKVVVVFPCLKSIGLEKIPNLEGFFLGMNIDFQFPSLDNVMIKGCSQMKVFTSGQSTTPKLKYIQTHVGKHNLECGLNCPMSPPSSESYIFSPATQGTHWSFHNLIEIKLGSFYKLEKILSSNELGQLQNLEKIQLKFCRYVEEVFEEVTNNIESETIVNFPKLREVELYKLESLKYIWKSNRWSILEFPNLTKLSISYCVSIEHVFTTSMVGTFLQLQELHIEGCDLMEVIVKKEEGECDVKVGEIMFPCLKSLKLEKLLSLKGFCLGKDEFLLPLMNNLEIRDCPEIRVFTEGLSVAPKLELVKTSFGSFDDAGEDINSFIMTKKQEGFQFGE